MKTRFYYIHILTAFVLSAMLLPACSRNQGDPISAAGCDSQADSLLYYYGQLSAADYWHSAKSDSALRSRQARDLYLEGLLDGIQAVAENQDIYNRGLKDGIKIADRLYNLNKEYNIEIDKAILFASIQYGLRSDSTVDIKLSRKGFYALLDEIRTDKIDNDDADISLKKEAHRLGMHRIGDNIYGIVQTEGDGIGVKKGDMIFINVEYIRPDGSEINIPSPENLIVGSPAMPEVMTKAYCSLRCGDKARFATTGDALFGSRSRLVGLSPSDIVLIDITLTDVVNHDTVNNYKVTNPDILPFLDKKTTKQPDNLPQSTKNTKFTQRNISNKPKS